MPIKPHTVSFSPTTDIWRWFVLRGAGFPVELLQQLSAPALASAAATWSEALEALQQGIAHALEAGDTISLEKKARLQAVKALRRGVVPNFLGESDASVLAQSTLQKLAEEVHTARIQLDSHYEAHESILADNLAAIASMPMLTEALTWQNAKAAGIALPRVRSIKTRATSKQRRMQRLVAKYIQRYCAKNDNIGFFGPVLWGTIDSRDGTGLSTPGSQAISKRAVFFEDWCIDVLAQQFASRDEILRQLCPRLHPTVRIEGTNLVIAGRGTTEVAKDVALVLEACTGVSAQCIAARLSQTGQAPEDVFELLEELADQEVILWQFDLPNVSGRALDQLRDQLIAMKGPLAEDAVATLTVLHALRCDVEAAAGDAEALSAALKALANYFTDCTGQDSTRSSGEMYAGRTLVYEDCTRDHSISFGPKFMASLNDPLELILQSARWFAQEGATRFRAAALAQYKHLVSASGGDTKVELLRVIAGMVPVLEESGPNSLIGGLLADLQNAWARIIPIGDSISPVTIPSEVIRDAVTAEFACIDDSWPGAAFMAPDIMVAARSPEEVLEGRALAVLGELHIGANTLIAPALLRWNESHDALAKAFAADVGDRYIETVPTKTVASRATNIGPEDTSLQLVVDETPSPRSKEMQLRVGDFYVEATKDGLCAVHLDTNKHFDIAEIMQSQLRAKLLQTFSPFGAATESPRITIDRLVVTRQRWTFAKEDLCEFPPTRGLGHFLAMRQWAAVHQMPSKLFYKSKEEVKPVYLDLDSPISIEIFASIAHGASAISFSEMLPLPEETWLRDDANQSYTSEIRLVFVDKT
tara:strand:+ start:230383 stop:232833 length:2451 start_codon:yes stop_codon:yes gene_type:complete